MADVQEYSVSINFKTKGAEDVEKKLNKTKDSLGKLQGIANGIKFTAIMAGAKRLGESMFKLSSATANYIETVNLFRASMGSAAEKATEFVDKAERLLGLDPENLRNSIASFYNLADGFGIASDRAYLMAQNLTQLSGDLSSFANISFEQAQKKLMSGFSGQILPLRQYGIALDQATLQEKAYSLGINQRVKDMTRAQKAELIYYQIMTSTTKMQGDLGRSLLSPANALRVMQNEFRALARAVGSIFIPIMMKLIPVVRAVTQVLTRAAQAIAALFGFKMSNYEADLSTVGNLLGGVGGDIEDIGDEAEGTAKKLNKMLMPFDELNNINFDTGAGSGAGAGAIGAGGGSLGLDLPQYDMFASLSESMDDVINRIQSMLQTLFQPIQNSWNTYGKGVIDSIKNSFNSILGLLGTIGKSFGEVWLNGTGEKTVGFIFQILTNIHTIIGNIADAFKNAWENNNTGTQIIQNLWNGFNNLLSIVEGFFGVIRDFTQSAEFQNFANAVLGIIKTISEVISSITERLKKIWEGGLKGAVEQFLGLFSRLAEILNIVFQALQPVIELILDQLQPVFEAAAKTIESFIKMLNGLLDFVIGVFTGDWNRAWSGLGSALDGFIGTAESFWQMLGGILENIWNNIVSFVENLGPNIWEFLKFSLKSNIESMKTFFTEKLPEIFSKVWEKIVDFFQNLGPNIQTLGTKLGEFLGNAIRTNLENTRTFFTEKVPKFFSETLPTFFKEKLPEFVRKVVDFAKNEFQTKWKLFTEKAPELAKNMILGLGEGINNMRQWFKDTILGFIDNFVNGFKEALGIHSPSTVFMEIATNTIQGFIDGIVAMKDKVVEKFEEIKTKVVDKFGEIKTKVSDKAHEIWDNVTKTFERIKNAITEPIERAKSTIETTINKIKGFFNFNWKLPSIKVPEMSWSTQAAPEWAAKILRALSLPTDVPKLNVRWVTKYAKGGFPDAGDLFLANEAGPELVGKIGNRTAVANQNQIVEAVAKGVYDAVVSANSQNNSNQTPYIVVNLGNENLYKGYGQYKNEQSNMYGITV